MLIAVALVVVLNMCSTFTPSNSGEKEQSNKAIN